MSRIIDNPICRHTAAFGVGWFLSLTHRENGMPYHMHLFRVSAIRDIAPLVRALFAQRLIRNMLRAFDRRKFAAWQRQRRLIRAQERRYDDMLAIYPPTLADLKRRGDGGAG